MKYSGYWVTMESHCVSISHCTFDDTELDPMTQWTQAWQNQDPNAPTTGYVSLEDALVAATKLLAKSEGVSLNESELERSRQFEPNWQGGLCEITSLSQMV
jgi:hypothetical protein